MPQRGRCPRPVDVNCAAIAEVFGLNPEVTAHQHQTAVVFTLSGCARLGSEHQLLQALAPYAYGIIYSCGKDGDHWAWALADRTVTGIAGHVTHSGLHQLATDAATPPGNRYHYRRITTSVSQPVNWPHPGNRRPTLIEPSCGSRYTVVFPAAQVLGLVNYSQRRSSLTARPCVVSEVSVAAGAGVAPATNTAPTSAAPTPAPARTVRARAWRSTTVDMPSLTCRCVCEPFPVQVASDRVPRLRKSHRLGQRPAEHPPTSPESFPYLPTPSRPQTCAGNRPIAMARHVSCANA